MNQTNQALRKLLKEIEETQDKNVDRYLMINEIKNIIKDSQKSISNREIIAARIGFLTFLPKDQQLVGIKNIKEHALELGFSDEEFEEFLTWLLQTVLKVESEFLLNLKK